MSSTANIPDLSFPTGALEQCYALVDCNNFFASCEQLFRPELRRQPVVVLSSNDGCVIARSQEAKQLGIKMGQPLFECRQLVEQHKVHLFSSNFGLYGDISHRIMAALAEFCPRLEVYSIDEAFLDLGGCDNLLGCGSLTEYARLMRAKIRQWTGITVSIGLARTQTLAKVASYLAKRSTEANGVLNLIETESIDRILEKVEVGEVWGVGWRSSEWLTGRGILNALQLKEMNEQTIQKKMGVMGLRLLYELRGIACFTLTTRPEPSHSITSSQSFGQKINSLDKLKGAVANHVSLAAEKLRRQNLVVRMLTVTLMYHSRSGKYHRDQQSSSITLPRAINNTTEILRHAMTLTEKLYSKERPYVKAGVLFNDLIPEGQSQTTLFADQFAATPNRKLMETIDRVNHQVGRGTLKYAVQLQSKSSRAKHEHGRRRYTTSWTELATVKA